MASVLHAVGTPLQLVALFLLLVAGLTRLLVRSRAWKLSPVTTRLVINRTFQAAMVALVIGVVSPTIAPILDRWANSEETFHGAVLSTGGEPITGATVNLITIATVSTNSLGQFDISVPHSRALKKYTLQVKAPGYQTSPVLTKTAAELKDVDIRLTPAPPELVKALEQPVIVGHFFGVPIIIVTLRVENTGSSTTYINNVQGKLSYGDVSFILSPVYWTIINPFGPFYPITGPFPIPAATNLDLRIVLITGMNFSILYQQLSQLPKYSVQLPCTQKYNGAVDPLTDQAYQIVKSYAGDHFAWKAGNWHFELDMTADNQVRSFSHDFVLSADEVDRLRASFDLLRECLGVNLTAPVAQDGILANFVPK